MARAGLGIALLHYLCAASLARGDLVALLPSWTAAPARIYAVMPARRGTPLALRRFLDFAIAELPARWVERPPRAGRHTLAGLSW